jgi:hypothetical protein
MNKIGLVLNLMNDLFEIGSVVVNNCKRYFEDLSNFIIFLLGGFFPLKNLDSCFAIFTDS